MAAVPKPWWRETIETVLWALVLALILRTFVVQAFWIPSGSMIPTLEVGDRVLVAKSGTPSPSQAGAAFVSSTPWIQAGLREADHRPAGRDHLNPKTARSHKRSGLRRST